MTIDFAQYAVLIVCIGLASIIGTVAGVSTIFKNLALMKAAKDPARIPPLAEMLAKDYATKSELIAVRCEFSERCKANHERVEKNLSELYSLNRSLTKELTDRLDRYHSELADWQRSVERQIGNIEGRINEL
jgi:t-SNARE complex subunit (syntaxin)